ncbi:MAG: hypothetical protein QW051_02285 [Candidatus Aenigmatarchaeota archaeon]
MASRVLFMSTDILKEFVGVDINVDDRILANSIYTAQEYYILRIIGSSMYNHLVNKIDTNTLNNDEKILLDKYIEPALSHYAMSEVYLYLSYRSTNAGVVNKESNASSPVAFDVISRLREEEISKGNYFAKILFDYLCANTALFPAFNSNTNIYDIIPTANNYNKIGYGYGINDSDVGYFECY